MNFTSEAGSHVRRAQGDVLQSLRRDLNEILLPELVSDQARSTAQLMDEMLAWIGVGLSDGGRLERESLDRIEALDLRQITGVPDCTYDGASELYDGAAMTPAAVNMATIAREARADAETLRAIVAAEAAQLAAEDEARARAMGVPPPLETLVTTERLDSWLHARFPDGQTGRTESLARVVGGYSKDTWLLRISGQLAGHDDLVLRRDLPFGPGENSVTEEFDILTRLYAAGVAVPKPLAIETDPVVVGVPFLIFPRLPGRAIFGDWDNVDPATRVDVARQVATCMAQYHALDPASLGLPVQSRADAVAQLVRFWRGKWERRRLYPSAILEMAYDWLERNVPQAPGQARLVHGDVSFRNTLIEDGRLVALLDWEFHHPGDPVEDLSYFQLVAEPYVDWATVIDAYHAAGGEPYDPARAKYYEIWRSTRNATTTATAWHGFVRGHYPVSKAAYQGLSLYRFFLRDVADKLKDVL